MSDLSRDAHDLLASAKDGGLPDDVQLARTRAALAEKIGAGIALGAATATLAKTASAPVATKAAAWTSSFAIKVMTLLTLTFGGAAGGYVYRAHQDLEVSGLHGPMTAAAPAARASGRYLPKVPVAPASAPASAEAEAEAAPVAEQAAPVAKQAAPVTEQAAPVTEQAAPMAEKRAPSAEAARPVAAPIVGPLSPRGLALRPSASVGAVPSKAPAALKPSPPWSTGVAPTMERAAAPATPPPTASATPTVRARGLAEDITHLREAQRALARGDVSRARREAEHVRADSSLAEEGEGMRVLADCAERSPAEARTAAQGFAQRRPESSLLPRIRAACLD